MSRGLNGYGGDVTRANIPDPGSFPRGWRSLAKLLIVFLRSRNQWRTWKVEKKRIPALDASINIFRKELLRCRELGLVDAERIYNVGLYLLLTDRDCAILKVQMVSSLENWHLRFTARQVALLLYEVCDDLIALLGRQFRESLLALSAAKDDIETFNKIYHALTQFREKNREFLYNSIRNLVAGHRSQDSLEFLRTVEGIDPLYVFNLGGEFYGIIKALIQFLTQALVRMATPETAFRQLLGSPKFRGIVASH